MKSGETFHARDRAAWRAWLKKHHASSGGVWLVYYKQGSGKPRVAYDDAVEEALCFGWIDGKVRAVDEERYAQWFTSRTSNSKWSALNLERARRLLDAGTMTPAGRALAEAALRAAKTSPPPPKATGRPPAPKDLAAALDGNARARACWDAFPPSCVRQYVAWIDSAKRPETRARRVGEAVALIARNTKKLLK
jgi:uncharacterized protein YdeI (YjbR/CyaY-like superfamily)